MFTNVYYINLDRRPDRKKNVMNQLSKINYKGPVERISAVDANQIDYSIMPTSLITKEGIDYALDKETPLYTYLTKGAIGCALSHKHVFEKILYGKDDYALILEDDIWFNEKFNEKLKEILSVMPEYDILWLGYHNKTDKDIRLNANKYLQVPEKLYGLFGYIINKKAASKMIDLFPITWQIDTEIPKVFSDLRVYAVKEEHRIIYSEPSQISHTFGTDIQRRDTFANTDSCPSQSEIVAIVIGIVILYIIYNRKKFRI
jgi:GR25 family glycosyltransferase involved in LPS biosynthesis